MLKSLLFVLISLSLFYFTGCEQQPKELKKEQGANPTVVTVESKDFETLLQNKPTAQLIDVRTVEEFNSGHLNNAHNIDFYDAAFSAQIASLKKNEPVFVYCAVGGRSAEAARLLQQQGFQQIIDLKGGIVAWQKSGKATIH